MFFTSKIDVVQKLNSILKQLDQGTTFIDSMVNSIVVYFELQAWQKCFYKWFRRMQKCIPLSKIFWKIMKWFSMIDICFSSPILKYWKQFSWNKEKFFIYELCDLNSLYLVNFFEETYSYKCFSELTSPDIHLCNYRWGLKWNSYMIKVNILDGNWTPI